MVSTLTTSVEMSSAQTTVCVEAIWEIVSFGGDCLFRGIFRPCLQYSIDIKSCLVGSYQHGLHGNGPLYSLHFLLLKPIFEAAFKNDCVLVLNNKKYTIDTFQTSRFSLETQHSRRC